MGVKVKLHTVLTSILDGGEAPVPKQHVLIVYNGSEGIKLHIVLMSILTGGEWSLSCFSHIIPKDQPLDFKARESSRVSYSWGSHFCLLVRS